MPKRPQYSSHYIDEWANGGYIFTQGYFEQREKSIIHNSNNGNFWVWPGGKIH